VHYECSNCTEESLTNCALVGDPLRYHSHFTATVQTTPQSLISAHELIAAGRLGTAVKKAHVLCSVKGAFEESEETAWQRTIDGEYDDIKKTWGEVDFISLTWAGFGI
jgi:tRNA-splicing endonuclease subunit Sen34